MSRITAIAVSMLILVAGPAAAKDVCVTSQTLSYTLVFKKVKRLEAPGTTTTLQGIFIFGASSSPVSGAATVRSDGSIRFGAMVHGLYDGLFHNVHIGARGSATFQATTYVDWDGDGVIDYSDFWTPIDCASVVLP